MCWYLVENMKRIGTKCCITRVKKLTACRTYGCKKVLLTLMHAHRVYIVVPMVPLGAGHLFGLESRSCCFRQVFLGQ